jgi:tetratricopeptide (TPR) repeat protein
MPALADTAADRVRAFKELQTPEPGARLTSSGGNRYDYWRIALDQFERWPLRGVGAGNYDRTYFEDRRTEEDVQQAHSLEMQALGETGALGAVGLLVFILSGMAALIARQRQLRRTRSAHALVIASGGIWITWLVHTSVDWIYLLPGVTGAAIASLAVLAGHWDIRGSTSALRPVRAVLFAGLVLGAASMAVLLLADHRRQQAEHLIAQDPSAAIDAARSSLKLAAGTPETYYVLAAAQARINQYHAARATLLEASRRKPHDFLPHALLGDLALRRGDTRLASAEYQRALVLNPRSTTLRSSLRAARLPRRG